MNSDPLDKLIVDEEGAMDSSLLASLITGSIRLSKDGEIIFDRPFFKQNDWKKIMLYLLARKAIFIKKLKRDFQEDVKPKEISEILNIPKNSVTKFLSRDLKGITKSEKGAHKIPNYNLYKCEEVLKNDKTKRSN